jgi:thioredoxin 1
MRNLSKKEFDIVIKENSVCVMDFYADWCGPCKIISKNLEEIEYESKNNKKDVVFFKIDTDVELELCKEYSIKSIPSILIFKNGVLVDILIGSLSITEIKGFIEKANEK